ncbi:Annexin A11 [Clonorchis sinensis]|uniref:Annexin n=1 Tax=Clonorchis sinensis TaxID=79923 RepID=A0A419Q2I1_CLOSI|nr:Annexin A11 [Clonorchis sinensis]
MYPGDLSAWNFGGPPSQGPGYPPSMTPGYPPTPGYPSGVPYDQQQPGYPAQPGYPGQFQPGHQGQTQPGYPAQLGYPGQPQTGYPAQPGYPGQPQTGYPAQPGYPGQPQTGYPAQPGYPGQPQTGYPAQPGYPGQPQTGYPAQPGYPGQPQPGHPGYTQSGYPGQPQQGHQQQGYQSQPGYSPMGGAIQGTPPAGAAPRSNPTLRPYPYFKPEEDCEKLRKAMKGLGTDEKAIIDVLAHRTADQRVQIVNKFKTMYGKDLIRELKSELTGHFEDVIVAMCYSLDEFDARELRRAMEGAGTDEQTLIEILCSRSNAQIRRIRDIYSKIFKGRNLEKDVMSETHGHFKRILVSLVQGNRDESTHVDMQAVQADAQALYNAGEKQLGTDESCFNRILVSKSEAHVRAVINAYGSLSRKDLEDALKSEMSGDLLQAFLAVTRCIRNKPGYFAKQLKKSMEGAGTRDRQLIRIVVTRCEVDMADIKVEFLRQNGKSLEAWIADDTSGDYKRMLLALIA